MPGRLFLIASLSAAAIVVQTLAGDANRIRLSWSDVAPLRARLEASGITSDTFASYVERVRESNARRVREGDLDHLVFYLLQSTRFTSLAPIEPALSAKALVDGLDPSARQEFFREPRTAMSRVSAEVRSRITAFLRAPAASGGDARLAHFRALVGASQADRPTGEATLAGEYLRAMKFVYEKEFVAQRSPRSGEAVAELYRTRGLSTDTAVEAGFLVHQGLGVLRSSSPDRRIRRVVIVGPGLDLAPRTSLVEAGPPESYQPWAVVDALLALGLSHVGDLEVVAADINPRVVEHLERARNSPPALTLVSEIQESATVSLTEEYRDYFAQLGRSVAKADPSPALVVSPSTGRLSKTFKVRSDVARTIRAETLDIVTERLQGPAFDLIIATNILPYFDDVQLMLAMTNIAGMLGQDGVFLHNEARPVMHEISTVLALPLEQSRHAVIARVHGAASPLVDSVWLHRKSRADR